MTVNIAEYGHFKRINDPNIILTFSKMNLDSKSITLKKICEVCDLLEIDIDCKELFESYKQSN